MHRYPRKPSQHRLERSHTHGRPAHGPRRPPGFRVTDRDLELLRFAAAHRFVLACHVQALWGSDRAVSYRRLSGLTRAGLLAHERIFHAQPGVYRATAGGLDAIDSPLPTPAVDLRTYRHDVGTAWLWLAARAGTYGSPLELWTERELRSHDRRDLTSGDEPLGVEIDGYDRAGQPRLHHPDVLVITAGRHGTALELELSLKSRRRLERILLGYATSPHVDRAMYLTDAHHVARGLGEVVSALGLDGVVSVHYLPESDRDPDWWLWRSIGQGGLR